MGNLSILRGALASAQVSSYTTGSITLPSARGAFVVPTAFQSIASATGTGASNTITFSSIPQDFASLHFRCTIKDAFTTDFTILNAPTLMRFNGVSTNSYRSHKVFGHGGGAALQTPSGNAAESYMYFYGSSLFSATGFTSFTGSLILDITDYASSTKKTVVKYLAGNDKNTGGSSSRAFVMGSGFFNDTSAVTSITFYAPGSYFTNETSISLYGIKGA